MSLKSIRSERGYLNREKQLLVWNHSNWKKIDRCYRRAQRRVERQVLRVSGDA